MITLLPACKRTTPDNTSTDSLSLSTEIEFVETDTQPVMDNNRIVWIVDPALEYDNVYYCSMCGYTANFFTYILDRATGQIDSYHDGHGGPNDLEWLYDSENGIFGVHHFGWENEIILHNVNEFSRHFSSYTNTLNFVRQVDSSSITIEESEWGEMVYNLGEKYANSKYAISFGSTFLTDFIYDQPDNLSDFLVYKNAIPVSIDGKWGFINIEGKTVVPLIFDHVASYDGDTAFVKINGKYGIIDVRSPDDH
ncbi:MAG: WG repeat-containing protein [Treponema sp.]|nr:WG repeat-containing protein [Treponema sp.]